MKIIFRSIDNILYALKNIWRWDKSFYLYFIPCIPLTVVLSLASTYFPKVLIDYMSFKDNISTAITGILVAFFGLLIAILVNNYCESKLQMREYNLSMLYQYAIMRKHMSTDYANTDNPEAITKYQHAMKDACSGKCAPEFIWQSLLGLFISLLGIFTYGSVIALISPWILILLFVSAFITYLISRWQTNYIEKNKDSWVNIDRKIGYLQSFSRKFDHAKDIRIYGMFGWLSDMLAGFQQERFGWTKKVSARTLGGTFFNALLTLIRNGAAYAVLIIMVLNNEIGAGDFVFSLARLQVFPHG